MNPSNYPRARRLKEMFERMRILASSKEETISLAEHNKIVQSLTKVNEALTAENTSLLQKLNSLQSDKQEKVSIEEYEALKKTNEEQKYKIIAIENTNAALQGMIEDIKGRRRATASTTTTKLPQISYID